jgi:cobalt-precorrin-5B (C1)-methyltransferase
MAFLCFMKKKKKLRSGFTTGACAAAAAKASVAMLVTGKYQNSVEIPFPVSPRASFAIIHQSSTESKQREVSSAVIKDAGDDPDVTNGAVIEAIATFAEILQPGSEAVRIYGGTGVGKVTKKGLAIPVGEPAINPVPRQMIRDAVAEVFLETGQEQKQVLVITVSIPQGEELATKTLNHRLGIVGGLSVLGTTGIVRPVSADAWTATISASMDVAKEAGLTDIILSTGRTSERAVQEYLTFAEEAQVMMGDYLHYSLVDAARHSFQQIHLAAMWAKVMKAGMKIPQTHVRNGALEVSAALEFLVSLGCEKALIAQLVGSNTAREIYMRLLENNRKDVIRRVCEAAREYAEDVSGLGVTVYLVDASRNIVVTVDRVVQS